MIYLLVAFWLPIIMVTTCKCPTGLGTHIAAAMLSSPRSGRPGGLSFPTQQAPHRGTGKSLSFPKSITLSFGTTAQPGPCPSMSKVFFGSSIHDSSLSSEDSGEPGWRPSCGSGLWATAQPAGLSRGQPLSEMCTRLPPSAQHRAPLGTTSARCSPEMWGVFWGEAVTSKALDALSPNCPFLSHEQIITGLVPTALHPEAST